MADAEDLRRRRREALGDRMRELRAERGLSQEALANKAGLDRSFLVEVETARHSIAVDRLCGIADALGIGVAELFTGEAFGPKVP